VIKRFSKLISAVYATVTVAVSAQRPVTRITFDEFCIAYNQGGYDYLSWLEVSFYIAV
jgi:hypothetical protein